MATAPKGVKPVAETLRDNGETDIDQALHVSIENYGTVDAEISFEAGTWVRLPAGMKRELPFVGDRYAGKMYVRFAQDAPDNEVTIIKLTHHC